MSQRFSDDEKIEAILKLAVRKDAGVEGSVRERLMASARELGLSEEAVNAAEKQWTAEQRQREELDEFGRNQRRDFYGHLVTYVAVNLFLLFISLRDGSPDSWVLYTILGWGIGIASHAYGTFSTHKDPTSSEFRRWRRRRDRGDDDDDDDDD